MSTKRIVDIRYPIHCEATLVQSQDFHLIVGTSLSAGKASRSHIPSKAMMIRRRSLMSSSRSVFVDIIVAVAIVVSTRTILTVQAFSSRHVVGSSALASRHHRSLLPSSSISTSSSSILSRRVRGISSITTTRYRRQNINHH